MTKQWPERPQPNIRPRVGRAMNPPNNPRWATCPYRGPRHDVSCHQGILYQVSYTLGSRGRYRAGPCPHCCRLDQEEV